MVIAVIYATEAVERIPFKLEFFQAFFSQLLKLRKHWDDHSLIQLIFIIACEQIFVFALYPTWEPVHRLIYKWCFSLCHSFSRFRDIPVFMLCMSDSLISISPKKLITESTISLITETWHQ